MKRKAKRKACKNCERLQRMTEYWGAQVHGLGSINNRLNHDLNSERRAFADFFHDVQLLRSQGAHALCGATWIRADALDAACKKYAEATEEKQ